MNDDPLIDRVRLQTVLAVARAGSPSAAARVANVPATTFYRQLEAMERAAGSALFSKQRGNWRPTTLGVKLVGIASDLERQMRDFRLAASGESRGGLLRVTTSESFANFYLAERISRFIDATPHVTVELIATNRRLDLAKGEADIAIRPHSQPGDGLVGRRAGRMLHALFAAETYFKAHGVPASEQDLRQHRLLAYGSEIAHFDAAEWTGHALQGRKPVACFNDLTSMARAVESGLGIAALPAHVGRQIKGARRLKLAGNGLPADIWILCHATQRRNADVTAFIRYFANEIKRNISIFE
jgi:DNA-binding transcriptional LysR family regulator